MRGISSSSSIIALCLLMAASVWAQSASANQSSAGNQRMQERITQDVYHKLAMLPQLSIFDNLSYKVNGSTVTRLGQVRNAVLKSEAEDAVKHIEGVETVDNQIQILPPSTNDDLIRRQVARAIFNDNRLFPYSVEAVPPIHIIVNGGHVTLDGVVNSQGDKNEAGLRANSVPGVFSVQNNLKVGTK